jgi:hypothetical protein
MPQFPTVPGTPIFSDAKPGPYTTALNPQQEMEFKGWVAMNKIPWQDTPTADYDMRGYWLNHIMGGKGEKGGINPSDLQFHFPDTYKTPYHHSFSNESQYALPTAPHWMGSDDKGWKLVNKQGFAVYTELPRGKKAK